MRRLDPRAFALLVVTALLVIASTALSAGNEPAFDTVLFGTLPLSLAVMGTLVASREPHNPIGWLLCGMGFWVSVAESGQGYGYYAADRGLPLGELGEWLVSWSWIVDGTGWAVVVLLFPDGRLPGRRWRALLWLALAAFVVSFLGGALSAERGQEFTSGENPFGVEGAVTRAALPLGVALLVATVLAAAVAAVLRFRAAHGVERQQLKWFACAGVLLAACLFLGGVYWDTSPLVLILIGLALNAMPLAVGVAILRYRLYDVDVLINRALVYGGLTAALGAAYLGVVLLTGLALGRSSDLAIAVSTLAVAALFGPARRRIQALVDRRFYRSRYDAARTLERFGGRLREELDLEALGDDLRGVARETVQPAHVSLWLRSRS